MPVCAAAAVRADRRARAAGGSSPVLEDRAPSDAGAHASIKPGAIHARPAILKFGNEAAHNKPATTARRYRLRASKPEICTARKLP